MERISVLAGISEVSLPKIFERALENLESGSQDVSDQSLALLIARSGPHNIHISPESRRRLASLIETDIGLVKGLSTLLLISTGQLDGPIDAALVSSIVSDYKNEKRWESVGPANKEFPENWMHDILFIAFGNSQISDDAIKDVLDFPPSNTDNRIATTKVSLWSLGLRSADGFSRGGTKGGGQRGQRGHTTLFCLGGGTKGTHHLVLFRWGAPFCPAKTTSVR